MIDPPEASPPSITRIAVVINAVTPYMRPLWSRLGEREDIELLLVTETPMERDRRWEVETDLPLEHVQLDSWTLDLAWMAVGSGFKTRFDSYVYVPKRPLTPLRRFSPHVVVAAGGGVWSSPANIAALAARRRYGWAVVPWWNTFTRERRTLPRRLAEPWVRYFFRSADAWLAGGSRHARDVVRLGADPNRTVIAPLTALGPSPPLERTGFLVPGQPRFLFVGRFIERKGIDVLLDAFRGLERGELWLVGDGPLRAFVEAESRGDSRIRVLGYADETSLPDLYGQADILVVPSLFEPWGLVVHEGLAHGLARDRDRSGRRCRRPRRSGRQRLRRPRRIPGRAPVRDALGFGVVALALAGSLRPHRPDASAVRDRPRGRSLRPRVPARPSAPP